MKNSNLLNRLLSYSHEKQSPHCFARYAAILILFLTCVTHAWADSSGDFYNMYLSYTFEGEGGSVSGNDNNTGVSVDVGTLTTGSLVLTGVYLKCWDNWDSYYWSVGGQLCYTNKGGSTQYVSCGTRSGKSGNNYEYQNSNPNLTIASYDQASGSFAFESWGQTWGDKDHDWGDRYFPKSAGHYTINYKIAPPAVNEGNDFTVTPSNLISGTGTSSDPFIIAYGETTTFKVTATKHHTDANSVLKVSWNNGSTWSTGANASTTQLTSSSFTPSSTKLSTTIKVKFNNSTASLDGAVSSREIFYIQQKPGLTVAAGSHGKVSFDDDRYGSSYSIDDDFEFNVAYDIYAQADDYYHFVDWTTENEDATIANDDAAHTTITVSDGAVTTVTASFAETMSTLSTSCSYDVGNPSYSAPSVSGSATTVGRITTRTITAASPGTGYTFTGWTITNGARTDGGGATANPITVRSNGDGETVTVTANYAEDLTSPWTLKGGTNLTGNNWSTAYAMTKKTGHSTESVAYYTLNITSTNSGISGSADNWSFKLNNGSWYGLAADGDSYWWTSSTSANQPLSTSGKNIQLCPNALGEYEVKVDWSSGNKVTVSFPTAYAVNFSRGTVIGTNGSVSATYSSVAFSSGTKVQSGKTVTLTAPAAKEGYTYRGWYSTNTADPSSPATNRYTDNSNYTPTVSAAITAYACYTINNHTITHSDASHGSYTIKVGDASAVSTNTTSDYNKTITLSATPASGYHFTGWTVSKAGGGTVTPSSSASANPATFSMPDDNVTITATFAANTYTITLDDNDGSGGSGSATVTFDNNNYSVSPVAVPTRTGYIFQGYYTSVDGDQIIDDEGAWVASAGDGYFTDASKDWVYVGNKTIYAKWTPITFTIHYDANGGTGSMSDQTAQYEVESTLDGKNSYILTNGFTAPSGYGVYYPSHPWNTSSDGTGTDIDATTYQSTLTSTDGATVNLYAQWSGRFALKANYDGGANGYFRVHYNTAIIEALTTLYPTRYGYLCDGYYTADEDGTKVLNGDGTVVEGNVSGYVTGGKWTYKGTQDFYAYWSQIKYDLTFDGNDCASYVGTATGEKASMDDVEYEEMVDLTPGTLARTGYTFAGWSKTACATSPTYVMDSWNHISATDGDDVTLYAVWTPITYTISFNGQGAYYVGESSRPIHYGDDYGTRNGYTSSLPTALRTGYDFQGWYTRPNGAGTHITDETQLTTAADHTLYAHWTKANRVYFYNNMGWENVYVTWDATWNYENANLGAGSMGKTQEAMTHIYGTNVWYKDIPAAILSSWKGNIAFTSESMPNYANFDIGQAVFRRDFDSDATMFVPKPNDEYKFIKNNYDKDHGTEYYSTAQEVDHNDKDEETNYRYQNGYWIRYEQLQSAYTVKGSWAWDDDHYVERYSLNDSVYVFTIRNLNANWNYYFNLYKHCTTTDEYSSVFKANSNITSANCTNVLFSAAFADDVVNTTLTTTVAGDYTFKFLFSKMGEVKLTVEYPYSVGDYRVVYGYTKGSAQTFASEYIKANANAVDTISMFIHSADSASSRSLYIQKCTAIAAGVPTWNTTYQSITLPTETASGKTSGVYNFRIAQDGSAAATGEAIGLYDGDFYIRTDSAHGGWDFYKQYPDNRLTLSEYSMTQTLSAPFSHYYCRYYSRTTTDITFTVATKYSPAVCPVQGGDATIGNEATTLPAAANVRFYWNHLTNATGRSYLKSAQGAGNKRYLVLHGTDNKLLDANGNTITGEGEGADQIHANEVLLGDSANWVYGIRIQAKPGAQVSLIAKYNGSDRYLIGGADSYETILGGDGTGNYEMKVVYDFKTNRLMTAWVPTLGGITDQLVDVDVMIERQYQGGGSTITFTKATEESEPGSLSAKRIIGALKMDYTDLVGNVASWTPTTRAKLMYFVSFPFDVNVSDIFGLNSAYGEAYVVQFYNGAKRAEKGFFEGDGTTTFWEDMPADSIMYANQGYCVVLDNEYFNGDIGNIWENKTYGGSVYLYFPSASREIGAISSSTKTITLPTHECKINRTFNGGKLNHKFTDSNWNIMGIPIFQNHTGDATAGTPGAIFTHDKAPTDTTGFDEFGYFYQWATDKSYTVTSAVGFTFLPMHSYMVQYAGNVSFTGAGPAVPASVAPRKTPMEENYKMELQVLNANEEMLNRTYVELRENAVDSFALNEDLFMVTNKHAVNVYTFAGTYDVSANVMSIDNHIIPMGIIVNQAGTYMFTMPSNFSGKVTLIDTQVGTRTNLALSDYTVTLQQGTFDDRFLLEINVNETPTAIDGVEGGSLKDGNAHKFIMNGIMYIVKDGVVYDARGNRVQ